MSDPTKASEDKLKKLELAKKNLEKSLKDSSKVHSNKPKIPYSKKATLPKRIYFFFENKYYDFIDFISKAIPVNRLTDKIDKIFPSFILFLLIIALLIYLFASGTFSLNFSKTYDLSVQVTDSSDNQLNEALVKLLKNEEILIAQTTDVFGETLFSDFKGKGNYTLNISKESYISKSIDFKLNKRNLIHNISLDINTEYVIIDENNQQQNREIKFVDNQALLIVSPLSLTFSCSNSQKTPDPTYKNISNGIVVVNQPANCGALRVSVTSDNYTNISNHVVPEDNKVILNKINLDRGTLTVNVKKLNNEPLTDVAVNVYTALHPEILSFTETTDVYGKHVFEVLPGNYLINLNKQGYLFIPKQGPYTVNVGQNKEVTLYLFTAQELENLDCSKSKYSLFCIDGELDCSNSYLQPYLTQTEDGCLIGNLGYLNVSLLDKDTNEEVIGNIFLYSKSKGSDQNYSSTGQIFAEESNATFDLIDLYDYQVRVSNTESYGYISPEPYDINGLDQNITIYLEYASELNSGSINVNVKDTFGNNVNNAKVYLFRENVDEDDFTLINEEPKTTNSSGDVNFDFQRAKREYYAFAIHDYENLQGTSDIDELDTNSVLELEIDLEYTSKILNLKVNELDYDITFYDYQNEEINKYVVNPVSGSDYNKQYIFEDGISKVYAIIKKDSFTSYQTELITLYTNLEIFKDIELKKLSNCSDIDIEFVGFFDESGQIKINEIDLVNNTLNDDYKIKFKYVSCLEDKDLAYTHIRAGKQQLIENDYIYLKDLSLQQEDIDLTYGYSFAGELNDWNSTFFNNYYDFDHTHSWANDESKWLEIDFSDININIVEFSLGVSFKEDALSPLSNYVISYRALAEKDENFTFSPNFENSGNWTIVPKGYFYSKTNKFEIPFIDSDYLLNWKLLDSNNVKLEETGNTYLLDIGENYKYNIDYLYLDDESRIGDFNSTSLYTNNNIIYKTYLFKDKHNNKKVTLNSPNLLIPDLNAFMGYSFLVDQNIFVKGFCLPSNTAKLVTEIFDPFTTPLHIPISTYNSSSTYTVSVTSTHPNNYIFIGDNNLSFKVENNFGAPMPGIDVEYQLSNTTTYSIGTTNANGVINNYSIDFDYDQLGEDIKFNFLFDSSFGLPNNMISTFKEIKSGIHVLDSMLVYDISYFSLNNQIEASISSKDYKILNSNNSLDDPELSSVDFILEGANNYKYFNKNLTVNEIKNINNLPLILTSEEQTIQAPIIVNNSELSSISNNLIITGKLNNLIKINSSVNQLISLPKLTFNFNNLGDINLNLISDYDYGFKKEDSENLTTVELIKNKVNTINLDYNLSAKKSLLLGQNPEDVILKSIVVNDLTTDLSPVIDISSLNSLLQTKYKDLEISKIPSTLSIPLTASKVSGDDTKFNKIGITFNLKIGSKDVMIKKDVLIKVFDKDKLFEITVDKNPIIDCISKDDCSENINYGLENKTKYYDFNFIDFTYPNNPSGLIKKVSADNQFPFILKEQLKNLTFKVDGDFEQLESLESLSKILNLNLKINYKFISLGLNDILNTPLEIELKNSSEAEVNWPEGVIGKLCLGVGGDIKENSMFIFGSCEEKNEYSQCKSGVDALPKVRYIWESSTSNNINWKGYDLSDEEETCVSDSGEYDTTGKFYCDSTQLLFTTILRLADNNVNDFNIYLVSDGVSEDLLKDFIDYSKYFMKITIPENFKNTFFNKKSVDNGNFKIEKDSFDPGLYNVKIKDFEKDKLDINISLIKEIPINQVNLFYYLPIDASLGMFSEADGTRDGYGTNNSYLLNDSEEIYINETDFKFYAQETPSAPINLNLYNYDSSFDNLIVDNVLRSKGTLLSIEGDNSSGKSTLTLRYSPSYPVPIMARAGCYKDTDLSYVLKKGEDISEVNPKHFLIWDFNKEINNSSTTVFDLKDKKKILSNGAYNNHSLDLESYLLEENIDSALINTILYFPASETLDNYKLSVTGIPSVSNNQDTFLYGLNNLEGVKELPLNSKIGFTIFNINKLFDLIENEKACIYSGLDKTEIKWNENVINLTQKNIEDIIDDSESYLTNCGEQPNPTNFGEQPNPTNFGE